MSSEPVRIDPCDDQGNDDQRRDQRYLDGRDHVLGEAALAYAARVEIGQDGDQDDRRRRYRFPVDESAGLQDRHQEGRGHDRHDGNRAGPVGEAHHPGEAEGDEVGSVSAAQEDIGAAGLRQRCRELGETERRGAGEEPGDQPCDENQRRAADGAGYFAGNEKDGCADDTPDDERRCLETTESAYEFAPARHTPRQETATRALRNILSHGPSSPQSSGCHEFCIVRATRSG